MKVVRKVFSKVKSIIQSKKNSVSLQDLLMDENVTDITIYGPNNIKYKKEVLEMESFVGKIVEINL